MRHNLEVHAALMRCHNEANLRLAFLTELKRQLRRGRITSSEYDQAKRQYWEDRARDKRIAQGKEYPTEAGTQRL